MVVLLLFAYALTLSVLVPSWFLLSGPVRERRTLVGLTYASLFILAWGAALLLGFLSPAALAAGAAAMATLGGVAAWFSHRDERLLARFAARVDDPVERPAAIAELKTRILEIGEESEHVVALMELASFPIRRLLDRCLFDEARGLVSFIDTELGHRLSEPDVAELRLLSARCDLHLGLVHEARDSLEEARANGACPDEVNALEALLCAARCDTQRAERLLARVAPEHAPERVNDLCALTSAHLGVARGDDAEAIVHLRAVGARRHVVHLLRALPGPATALAERLERPSMPYR